MADVVRYTPEELVKIEKEFRYTVFGQGITIFIADSSVARRRTLMNDIKKSGYDIVVDVSKLFELQAALDKCATPMIGIILDLSLPKLIPGDFVVRTMERYPDAVIIVTHEKASKEQIAQATGNGAAVVMERPYTSQDIIDKLVSFGLKISI